MKITVMSVGVAVLAATLALPKAASAQVQTSTEAQLAQRAAQSPHDISSLLDLAKFYFEQHRFEEASRTLSRAMAVIQQEQLIVVPAPKPSASATPFTPLANLSNLERVQALRVGGDVKEPKRIKSVEPVYPPGALAEKVEGFVIIEAVIGPDGRVHEAKVIKGHPSFDAAALDAVLQWAYVPSTLDGAPISVIINVTVMFKLR
jgi:TonB family protein